MPSHPQYVPLAGSERVEPPGARRIGPADPGERIEVSVYLRSRPTAQSVNELLRQGRVMTREEYADTFSISPDQFAPVEAFARSYNLTVVETDPVRRRMVLAGTVADMSKAFRVELNRYELEGHTYRIRTGPVHVPSELSSLIEGVFGLDNRPQARPGVKFAPVSEESPLAAISYTPPQLASLYNFPTSGDGTGQCIGIIEFGGGYTEADLNAYFAKLNLPTPRVSSVSVDGQQNAPTGDPNNLADWEVTLDIEVSGGVATGANIVVYFAPFSDRGWVDVVTTAVFDTLHKPSVLSISWGEAEALWTMQGMRMIDQAFQTAALLGVTVCCSSGDDGSKDKVSDGKAHAHFPASSPFVLACGGTRLEAAGGDITSEVVWNNSDGASGGGISDVFDLPDWQKGAGIPPSINPGRRIGRGLPDVAADADPETGYQIYIDGQDHVVGGTSAATPLWAALFALINQQLEEPIGYVNPQLYQQLSLVAEVVHDITVGNNGGYQAAVGWDACTGLGSPNGANWLAALIY